MTATRKLLSVSLFLTGLVLDLLFNVKLVFLSSSSIVSDLSLYYMVGCCFMLPVKPELFSLGVILYHPTLCPAAPGSHNS